MSATTTATATTSIAPDEATRAAWRAERLRAELSADGRAGLYELLAPVRGARLGERFRLEGLFAAGRQGFVFDARDEARDDAPVVVKQPAFDYRAPVRYSRALAGAMRTALRAEHAVLAACTTGHLPRPVALLEAPSPVPVARDSNVLGACETFVAQERLEGEDLERASHGAWRAMAPAAREQAAWRVALEFKWFWEGLRAQGFHYADVSARNVLLAPDGAAGPPVRFVDAASAIHLSDADGREVVLADATPAFLTPRLCEAFQSRRPVSASLAAALPPLAKVLHFALTLRHPRNGAPLEADAPELGAYSPACRAALVAMADVDGDPARLPAALGALAAWIER